MGLRIWLPLNGTLENQGLSDLQMTASSNAYTSGKIGSAIQFNGSNQITSTSTIGDGLTEFSFSCWIYPTTLDSLWRRIMGIGAHTRAHLDITSGNALRFFVSLDGTTSNYVNASSSSALSTNTWYHICGTIDNDYIKLYINGDLVASAPISDKTISYTNADYFRIGGINSGNQFIGSMNDARFYDHCLSAKEVKELSKGLVLHYPLNRDGFGGDNLIVDTLKDSGESHTTYNIADYNFTESVVSGDTYTVSAKVNASSEKKGICFYHSGGSYKMGAWMPINDTGIYTATFTATDNMASRTAGAGHGYCRVYVSNNASMQGSTPLSGTANVEWIKVEKGGVATPWCPNSADSLYSEMGLDGTTEYDCSGYKYNGEKIGALTYTSDTPRYHVSTHISETTQKIHIPNLTTVGFGDSYSFAWWGKRSSNSPMFWGFSDGIRLNGMYLGTLWNTGDGPNNPLYNIGTTTQVTAPSTGVWHHYVMTGNGTKCYVYLDGELWAEAKTYKAISGTSIYINGWNSSTTYGSNDTSISDFRIYSTALDADSVRSLYNTAASIADNGTILTYELEEG